MKNFNEDMCMRHSYNLLLGKKTMDELIEEQNLTEGEQDIAWAVLTHDILGYTDHKIKELEDAWQKARKEAINQGTAQLFIKNVKRSPYPLSESSDVH